MTTENGKPRTMTDRKPTTSNLTNAWNSLFPSIANPSLESLGDQLTGLLCLVAASVHLTMVVTSRQVVDAGPWEQLSLLTTTACYAIWRYRWSFSAEHLDLSRKICQFLATYICIRWLFIWMTANPLQIYIHICSGLLYMPLLIGCLKLLEANKRVIMLITIFIIISPILLSHQTSLVDTPFSDWRLGASLAGFYVVFSHLLTSILQLKKKVLQLTESNIKLGQTAITDSLTQLLNRRGFEDLRQQTQYENSGIIMLDIDHFKSINDRFGHDIGDVVLATVASKLKQVTRTEDLVCRWGGEEFLLVVVLNKNEPDANTFLFQLATKILKSIKTVDWSPIHPELKTVTASAGTMLISDESDFQQALIAADHALLNAKRAGRNRVNVGSITVESQNT